MTMLGTEGFAELLQLGEMYKFEQPLLRLIKRKLIELESVFKFRDVAGLENLEQRKVDFINVVDIIGSLEKFIKVLCVEMQNDPEQKLIKESQQLLGDILEVDLLNVGETGETRDVGVSITTKLEVALESLKKIIFPEILDKALESRHPFEAEAFSGDEFLVGAAKDLADQKKRLGL
jgi:hypothetical protein